MGFFKGAKTAVKQEWRATMLLQTRGIEPTLEYAEVAPGTWVQIWRIQCPFCDHVSWMEKSHPLNERAPGDRHVVRGNLVEHLKREHADALDVDQPVAVSSPANAATGSRMPTTAVMPEQPPSQHVEHAVPLAPSEPDDLSDVPSRIEPGKNMPPPPVTAEDWEYAAIRLGAAGAMFEWNGTGILIAAEALVPYRERIDVSGVTAAEVAAIEHFLDNAEQYAPELRSSLAQELGESARAKVTGLPAATPAEFIMIAALAAPETDLGCSATAVLKSDRLHTQLSTCDERGRVIDRAAGLQQAHNPMDPVP